MVEEIFHFGHAWHQRKPLTRTASSFATQLPLQKHVILLRQSSRHGSFSAAPSFCSLISPLPSESSSKSHLFPLPDLLSCQHFFPPNLLLLSKSQSKKTIVFSLIANTCAATVIKFSAIILKLQAIRSLLKLTRLQNLFGYGRMRAVGIEYIFFH